MYTPQALTPIIGRDRETEILREQLRGGRRLITLTGPAGVGKSRLAQAVSDRIDQRAQYLDAGPDPDPERLVRIMNDLREALAPADLLVVDNCDLASDVLVETIAELLATTRGLRILCTSRAPLGLYGESLFPVPPLALPSTRDTHTTSQLARVPAVALFVQRAQAVRPAFALTSENREVVKEICVRLDGLPLALELAAFKVKLLQPGTLLARLADGLDVLDGGPPNMPARHRAMRVAIASGFDRLSGTERAALSNLAVFVGGFGQDSFTWVSGGATDDLLETLVDKSFVVMHDRPSGEPRFTILGTVRLFLLDQLRACTAMESARRRHAAYFLMMARVAERHLKLADQQSWLERVALEYDNLRVAHRFLVEHDEKLRAATLAACLLRYWITSGRARDGMHWLGHSLTDNELPETTGAAKAYDAAGRLTTHLSRLEEAVGYHERALDIYRRCSDARGVATQLHCLGRIALLRGDENLARELLGKGLAVDVEGSEAAWQAEASLDWAVLEYAEGRRACAVRSLSTALTELEAVGDIRTAALARCLLGEIYAAEGELDRAECSCRTALEALWELTDLAATRCCLEILAAIIFANRDEDAIDRCREVVRFAAVAGSLCDCSDSALPIGRILDTGGCVRQTRTVLGDEEFAQEWSRATALPVHEVIAEAITASSPNSAVSAASRATRFVELTPRQREVALLVARGMTNRQIARSLEISEWTAINHVRRIMQKLDCPSRVHVARMLGSGGP